MPNFKTLSAQSQGILLGLFAMWAFSMNDGAYKYAMQLTNIGTAIFTGGVFSFLFLLLFAYVKKISILPKNPIKGLIYGLCFLAEQIAFIYALKYIPMAELFVIVLASPVAVLILSALFLKEILKPREILAIMLGLSGALIVVGTPLLSNAAPTTAHQAIPQMAWILAVSNIFLNAIKIIFLRKHCRDESSISLAVIAIGVLTIAFATQVNWTTFNIPFSATATLFIGGFLGALGSVYYVRAFQLAKAPLVSATQYSQILFVVIMGVFWFHEELIMSAIIGSILILLSGYVLYLKNSKE